MSKAQIQILVLPDATVRIRAGHGNNVGFVAQKILTRDEWEREIARVDKLLDTAEKIAEEGAAHRKAVAEEAAKNPSTVARVGGVNVNIKGSKREEAGGSPVGGMDAARRREQQKADADYRAKNPGGFTAPAAPRAVTEAVLTRLGAEISKLMPAVKLVADEANQALTVFHKTTAEAIGAVKVGAELLEQPIKTSVEALAEDVRSVVVAFGEKVKAEAKAKADALAAGRAEPTAPELPPDAVVPSAPADPAVPPPVSDAPSAPPAPDAKPAKAEKPEKPAKPKGRK